MLKAEIWVVAKSGLPGLSIMEVTNGAKLGAHQATYDRKAVDPNSTQCAIDV